MLFWLGLVTGLIIGWLIEWLVDWRFWRQNLNTSLDEERRWRTELDDAHREIKNLQAQLSGSATTNANFEEIRGINADFAQKLQAAGIHTYAQLAELSPERIIQIIRPTLQQSMNPASWIAQAKQLAQRKEGD